MHSRLRALLLATLLAFTAQPSLAAVERHILIDDCVVSGCSNETCSDGKSLAEAGASACIAKPEYACYPTLGECKRQTDGKCGWTPSAALAACVLHPPKEPGTVMPPRKPLLAPPPAAPAPAPSK